MVKEILIDGIPVMYGTQVKGSVNTSTSTVPTFMGVVNQGTKNIGHDLDISKVSYEGYTDYKALSEKLTDMLENPAMVTVREDIFPGGDERPFTIKRNYYDCIVDGADYEIKPEDHTVHNLKLKTGKMVETVDYL